MRKFLPVSLALALVLTVLATAMVAVRGPAEATGNPPSSECAGLIFLVKVEDPDDTVAAGYKFDFSHDDEEVDIFDNPPAGGVIPFDRVIVKAGTNSEVYSFNEATSAFNLDGDNGKDISHVTLCYDEDPTATPTATNTPEPTATNTPEPTATNTPEPTATNTPEPTATDTPEPTATSTPEPTETSTPEPTSTNTPEPTSTNTPEPTATPTEDCCDERPTRTSTPVPPTETPIPPTETPVPPTGEVPPDAPQIAPPETGSGGYLEDAERSDFYGVGIVLAAALAFLGFMLFVIYRFLLS